MASGYVERDSHTRFFMPSISVSTDKPKIHSYPLKKDRLKNLSFGTKISKLRRNRRRRIQTLLQR